MPETTKKTKDPYIGKWFNHSSYGPSEIVSIGSADTQYCAKSKHDPGHYMVNTTTIKTLDKEKKLFKTAEEAGETGE